MVTTCVSPESSGERLKSAGETKLREAGTAPEALLGSTKMRTANAMTSANRADTTRTFDCLHDDALWLNRSSTKAMLDLHLAGRTEAVGETP